MKTTVTIPKSCDYPKLRIGITQVNNGVVVLCHSENSVTVVHAADKSGYMVGDWLNVNEADYKDTPPGTIVELTNDI